MNVICPKCHIPMVLSEDRTEVECQICGNSFLVMIEEEEPDKTVSKEVILNAFESAKSLINSSMEKRADLSATIGGNWGKVYFALLKIAGEGFNVSEEQLTSYILRAGISGMMSKYISLLQMVLSSEQMVKEGRLRQETVDSLLVDLTRFDPEVNLDDIFSTGNEGEQ